MAVFVVHTPPSRSLKSKKYLMPTPPLQAILQRTLRIIVARNTLWTFGCFLTLPLALLTYFAYPLFMQEVIREKLPFLCIVFFLLYSIVIFGKIGSIITADTFDKTTISREMHFKAFFHFFPKLFILDSILFFFLIFLAIILFLPLWIFFIQYGFSAAQPILSFGLGIYLIFTGIIFFIRQYSYCYLILSHTSTYRSIHLGSLLFLRNFRESMSIGSFLTFIRVSWYILLVLLLEKILLPEPSLLIKFSFFLLLFIPCNTFMQTAWTILFKTLASPTQKDNLQKETPLLKKDMVIGLDQV